MKKQITILLLAIMAFDAGGFIFGLQVRQLVHKFAVTTIIHSENLPTEILTIRLSKKKFDQIKIHEREFRLDGGMYDIVWSETAGEDLIVYCYRDITEEKMAAKILGFLANKTKENSASSEQIVHSILVGFTFFTPETLFDIQSISVIDRVSTPHNFLTIARQRNIDLPPPRSSSV